MSVLSCDCQVYEMCPSCAPSPEEFERVNGLRDEVLRKAVVPAPTYTLADLTALAERYQAEKQGDSTEGLRRLFIGGLLEWLSAREAGLIEEGE